MKKAISIPGPKKNIVFDGASELQHAPLDFLININKTYPNIANWRLLHLNIVHITKPEWVQFVLQTNQKSYIKSSQYASLKLVLGEGLVTSEGEHWKKQRRLIQPSFHKQAITSFYSTMLECTNEMIDSWKNQAQKGEKIDFANEMMKITLQIIGKTMLSTDVKKEAKAVEVAIDYLIKAVNHKTMRAVNLPIWFPNRANFTFKRHLKSLHHIIDGIINERRANPNSDRNDLLDMLMQARYEDTNELMPDDLLRDEVMTVFLAGHETTANMLSWTFYLLSQHPDIYKKLKIEIDSIVGQEEVQFRHLAQFSLTKACLNESMRLYPPVWLIGRRATEDNWVGDYFIPKNTDVFITPYNVHRNEDYWKQPNEFIPERWQSESIKDVHKYAFFPFAIGPRKCIGDQFALMESELILIKVLQKCDFTYTRTEAPQMDPSVTLRVKNGVPMLVTFK